ncbi:MAG: zinc metallopeptidase [Saprospiraceae bacterium]|nr:zinc metallopeptidase [Saprospiraceae bacterium]
MIYFILTGALSLAGMYVSNRLQSKFKAYSKIGLRGNKSGREIAEDMLQYYGLHNVRVLESHGFLSDHYNPVNRTVNLSPDVFQGRSVAAAAVAAHECGHAVQHDTAYAMLQLRSKLVPVVKFASVAQQYLMLAAFMLANTFPSLMLVTIIAFAITTLFSIITLPVEFDASKRALAWIDQRGVVTPQEYQGAKDALWWAGMTYVAAALSSLVMLVYLILRYVGANR